MAKAKVEEKLYKQFEMDQRIDGMNNYLQKLKVQSTSIPISSQAISSSQVTLPNASASNVISKDQQGPAVVNSVSTFPKVTSLITSISSPEFTTFGMNSSAQPIIPGNLFTKTEEPAVPVVSKHFVNPLESPHFSRRNSSSVVNESTYQEFLNVQKKQIILLEMTVAQQARSELLSHKPPCSLWSEGSLLHGDPSCPLACLHLWILEHLKSKLDHHMLRTALFCCCNYTCRFHHYLWHMQAFLQT